MSARTLQIGPLLNGLNSSKTVTDVAMSAASPTGTDMADRTRNKRWMGRSKEPSIPLQITRRDQSGLLPRVGSCMSDLSFKTWSDAFSRESSRLATFPAPCHQETFRWHLGHDQKIMPRSKARAGKRHQCLARRHGVLSFPSI